MFAVREAVTLASPRPERPVNLIAGGTLARRFARSLRPTARNPDAGGPFGDLTVMPAGELRRAQGQDHGRAWREVANGDLQPGPGGQRGQFGLLQPGPV